MAAPVAGLDKQRMVAELANFLAEISDEKSLVEFLTSFLTPLETRNVANRLRVAMELLRGKTLTEVRRELHVGYSTVRPVDILLSRLLPGYGTSLPHMLSLPEAAQKRGLLRLKRRSPLLALIAGRSTR